MLDSSAPTPSTAMAEASLMAQVNMAKARAGLGDRAPPAGRATLCASAPHSSMPAPLTPPPNTSPDSPAAAAPRPAPSRNRPAPTTITRLLARKAMRAEVLCATQSQAGWAAAPPSAIIPSTTVLTSGLARARAAK
jgi:hypothetical protein